MVIAKRMREDDEFESFSRHIQMLRRYWLELFQFDLDSKKTKTKAVRDNCNPEWHDVLTMTIKDPKVPIKLTVYDRDTFSEDDNMGMANVDVNPYIECLQMGSDFHHLPDGTKLETVQPNDNNHLVEESNIIWNKDAITQDMLLQLRNVETGQIEVQIEITPVENHHVSL